MAASALNSGILLEAPISLAVTWNVSGSPKSFRAVTSSFPVMVLILEVSNLLWSSELNSETMASRVPNNLYKCGVGP